MIYYKKLLLSVFFLLGGKWSRAGHTCRGGGQRTIYHSLFVPSPVSVPGIKLRLLGFAASTFIYLEGHVIIF